MRDRIRQLEAVSRQLEPGAVQRMDMFREAGDYAENFLQGLDAAQTFIADDGYSQGLETAISEDPTALDALLRMVGSAVDRPGINPASGGHMGYIPGGGIYPAALGDYLADVSNRFSGVAYASPGAARMEKLLVDWMAGLIGFPASSGGDLTSGGSVANLAAIVTAREAMGIRARDIPGSAVYLSEQVHHCVKRAFNVAGLGECLQRIVPLDERYRMDPVALESMIREDVERGVRPWLLVASAGTTDTGAVDPMTALADIATNFGMWFHVDAAYGGFFILCEEGRKVLGGIERADSVVMDPHKSLFLPYGTGAVLVRDVDRLANAHAYQAHYMQDAKKHAEETRQSWSPADLSAELSRPFRGMRMWLPLRLFGLRPFRAALEEKMWLARYFHQRIGDMPGFETGPEPELCVVTYRYVPRHGDADEFNQRLLKAVHEDGKVFITSTVLEGKFILRLAALHYRTHLETVDYLLDLLERKAHEFDRP